MTGSAISDADSRTLHPYRIKQIRMQPLISIHIPKTAGTNFTQTLQVIYGDKVHLDYGTEWDLVTARTCAPEIAADPAGFANRFQVIHGHYHYLKYAQVYAGAPVLATLRHPVARIVSQYRHIALHGDRNIRQHQLVMDGEIDVLRLAQFPFIRRALSAYLEGISIEDLTHAIIQEHFAETVERFCTQIGFDPQNRKIQKLIAKPINSREKTKWDSNAVPVDPAVFPEIEKICAEDMVIYNRALERFVS